MGLAAAGRVAIRHDGRLYFRGLRHIDDLIIQDRAASTSCSSSSCPVMGEPLYVLHDDFSVTAL